MLFWYKSKVFVTHFLAFSSNKNEMEILIEASRSFFIKHQMRKSQCLFSFKIKKQTNIFGVPQQLVKDYSGRIQKCV